MVLPLPLSNGQHSSLIIVHAPTLDSYDEDVGHFHSELRKVPRDDKLVLLGDFNARR